MKSLIERLRAFVSSGSVVLNQLCDRFTSPRPSVLESRIDALERAMDVQAALNGSLDVEVKLIQALLERVQKTLRFVLIGFIISSTLSALAIAAVLMRSFK